MGSRFSSFFVTCSSRASPAMLPETSLGDLPESIVGSVLVHLNPQEICKLAGINRAFRCASSADFVWESKLPENYDSIVSRVFGNEDKQSSLNLCKKDIYAKLSTPNSIDKDTKKVWLHKGTGRPWVQISFNGLSITGIDDRRYWRRISTEESKFSSLAYLQQVWWFEVDGEVEFPFPPSTSAYNLGGLSGGVGGESATVTRFMDGI